MELKRFTVFPKISIFNVISEYYIAFIALTKLKSSFTGFIVFLKNKYYLKIYE